MKTDQEVRFKIARYAVLSTLLFVGFLLARQIGWQGNKTLHTVMETVSTLLALMVGVLALIRYYTKKTNTFLLVGSGFIGTAFLDGYHAIVTSAFFDIYFPSPAASLIPWSWVASRAFLSTLMVLSCWAGQHDASEDREKGSPIPEWIVFSGMGAATLLSFFFFAFYPLPRAYYPELFFGRPEEFIPGFLFLVALVAYLKKGLWKEDSFEDWLVMSLIVGLMGQVMFMSLSFRLFDTMFDTAHFLKKVSYVFVMQGLLVVMFQLFKKTESVKANLEEALEETQAATLKAWEEKKAAETSRTKLEEVLKEVESSRKELAETNEFMLGREEKIAELKEEITCLKEKSEALTS